MDCGTVSVGSLHFQFLWVNLVPGARARARLLSSAFYDKFAAVGGSTDLAGPTAQPPDGCSERDLL